MNIIRKCFLLLVASMFVAFSAYPLSNYQHKFADNSAVANGGQLITRWYELKHFYYIDFLVDASVGSGTITIQYASENPDKVPTAAIIDDATVTPFVAGTVAGTIGGVITKNFVRAVLDCTAGPCTIDSGMFTAKGQVSR